MKLYFLTLASVVAVISALPNEEGTTKCVLGPFKMERMQCDCASDGKHFTCQGLSKTEGTTQCTPGPYDKPARDGCNCASDGMHYSCPETMCDPNQVISRGAQKCFCSPDGSKVLC